MNLKDIKNKDVTIPYEAFYTLMQGRPRRLQRLCLRCRKRFISMGSHNRICGTCAVVNERVSLIAAGVAYTSR